MTQPPSGTVTFLFTDIEGSTRRWDEAPEAMQHALQRHDAILRTAIAQHGGYVFKTVGDAFHAAFTTPQAAFAAAVEAQRTLAARGWGSAVRMALHTGTADEREGDYFGPTLNRVARLRDAGHGGQILLTAAAHQLVWERVPDGVELRDLGIHRLRDLTGPEHIYQAAVWGLPADFPPLRVVDDLRTALPAPLTSFIGREQEVEEAARLLETARLVTLTGPGGTGKTRLALAVAERRQRVYADGVWFVDLSSITDADLVASVIAQTLGVRAGEGQSIAEALKAYLQEKHALLLLDNFEQVVEAAPLLRELLISAARVKLLVTSRILLRLSAEREYAVPPLPVPDLSRAPDTASLTELASVALFVARAQAAKPDFALTAANAATVAAICAHVDGLPLALELAAARIRVLTPQALLARLDERLTVLTGGSRDLPARQQTLRGAIRWSDDLLSEPERALFRRLAVFAGGCTLAATEVVCNGDGDLAGDLLDLMASLVENSLVQQGEGAEGEPRFSMLETIREYALEQLAAGGAIENLRERHARYYASLAEDAEQAPHGHVRPLWLLRIEQELGNLRAALAWAIRAGEADLALRLAVALAPYWNLRGLWSEGRQSLASALAGGAWGALAVRADATSHLAQFTGWLGEPEAAERYLQAGVVLARESGDVLTLARALGRLAQKDLPGGDLARAQRLAEESLALYRSASDPLGVANALDQLGTVAAERGEYGWAAALYQESLALRRNADDALGVAFSLGSLGTIRLAQGDLAEAIRLFEESLVQLRALGDTPAVAGRLATLGVAYLLAGDVARARAHLAEALVMEQALRHVGSAAQCVEGLAGVAAACGDPERATRLFGAGEAAREDADWHTPRPYQPAYQRALRGLRRALGDAAFEAAWAEGRTLSLDAAVPLALEQTQPPGSP